MSQVEKLCCSVDKVEPEDYEGVYRSGDNTVYYELWDDRHVSLF